MPFPGLLSKQEWTEAPTPKSQGETKAQKSCLLSILGLLIWELG